MTTPTDSAPTQRRSVLRDATFMRLWTATTASGLATWALPFVLGLAVVDRVLTPAGLGLVLGMRTVGFLLAVPASGVLADRYSRRAVVRTAAITASTATALAATTLGNSLPLVAACAAVAGAGQGACRPAFQALTAEVVDADLRQQANAAITIAVRVTTLVAPGLTALLSTVLGVRSLLAGITLFWLIAALVPPPGSWKGAETTDTAETGAGTSGRSFTALAAEYADGVREARRHRWFLPVLGALSAIIATGYSATGVILPLVSRDRFGTEAVLAGAMTAYVVGALLGAVVIARWRPRTQGFAALAGLACYCLAPLSLLLPVSPLVIVAAYVVAGLGLELFNVPWFTAMQREMDPSKLARVSSVDFLLSYGLAPIGLAFIAPAVAAFGAPLVLGVCAAVCLTAPALAAVAPGARHFSTERPARNGVPA